MGCGKWMAGLVLGCWTLIAAGGCVTLDGHRRLQAQHRTVLAEKESLTQELFDARSVNDSLRTRVGSLDRELDVKDELVANLRTENELLDEMRRLTQTELEGLANRQTLNPITIAGPKLPQSLDNALKRFADEHPSQVAYDSALGRLKWKADLLFGPGSDVVKESSKAALRGFAEVVNSPLATGFEVIVTGHTDTQPIKFAKAKHPTNWHLSAHRAISVARNLLKNGYSAKRVGVMGCGEYRPIGDNGTDAGRAQNRRVEIYIVPAGSIIEATADAGSGTGIPAAVAMSR